MITCLNLVKMGMFGSLLTGVISCLCRVGESQQAGGAATTTSALYIGQFSVLTTMVHGCPQIWSTFMTSLVGLQLIGRGCTIGGWRCQTPRELGEGTTLPAAFTPHACQAIVAL